MFSCPAPPPIHRPWRDRPRYELKLDVSRDLRHVAGDETVAFTPNLPTDRLVFRLWPNGPSQLKAGSRLDVRDETVDGRRAVVRRPDPTTLVVATHLRQGQTVTAHLLWTLRLPSNFRDRIAKLRTGIRLGSFFPLLAWDGRRGWVTDPATRVLAETSTSPTADFDVRVKVPNGMQALVSGTRVADKHWQAGAVRDVAVAVGRFRTAATVVQLHHPVNVIVAVAGALPRPRTVLRLASRALRHYVRTYGPYPWRTFTVVGDPDLVNEGIEYPTLVFIGPGNIERLVVDHETAHQWFYSLVGNDQAKDPWLDEALATWSQERLDGVDGEGYFGPAHHVGAPMTFWAGKARSYYREIYGGGPEALRSLQAPAKVDCALRFYVARDAYRIAQPADLLGELDRFIPGASGRLARFGIHR
jgi:hypothetical protein